MRPSCLERPASRPLFPTRSSWRHARTELGARSGPLPASDGHVRYSRRGDHFVYAWTGALEPAHTAAESTSGSSRGDNIDVNCAVRWPCHGRPRHRSGDHHSKRSLVGHAAPPGGSVRGDHDLRHLGRLPEPVLLLGALSVAALRAGAVHRYAASQAAAPLDHAWFGEKPTWWPGFLPFSPAFLILPFPGSFRLTCYYYRKFYYRSYFMRRPAAPSAPRCQASTAARPAS